MASCYWSRERSGRQIAWFERELQAASSDWKIVVFHHALYSSGDRHGSNLLLREALEPLLVKYNVSLVFNGHDHFYERVKPQHGIAYFVVGSGGQLRVGDIDRTSGITAKGFDTDQAFMAAEIAGDEMYFNAISRVGQTVDSGVLRRRTTRLDSRSVQTSTERPSTATSKARPPGVTFLWRWRLSRCCFG